jgi:hypothetical protein
MFPPYYSVSPIQSLSPFSQSTPREVGAAPGVGERCQAVLKFVRAEYKRIPFPGQDFIFLLNIFLISVL